MNVVERNNLYIKGIVDGEGLFPHLDEAPRAGLFAWDFGLAELPQEPGVIVIRGPRQFGKSTWLEHQLRETLKVFGAGTALFLNGDYIAGPDELEPEIESLTHQFPQGSRVRRLFIDEITAVSGWQKAVKRLVDSGALRRTLLVTTGSKASDIRREAELLPRRKGKLARTIYLFAQIPFKSFRDKALARLGPDTLAAYLITGGSPPACASILDTGAIPEHVFQTTAEWVYGECARSGRSRAMLLRLLEQLMRRGGSGFLEKPQSTHSSIYSRRTPGGRRGTRRPRRSSRHLQRSVAPGSSGPLQRSSFADRRKRVARSRLVRSMGDRTPTKSTSFARGRRGSR